MFMQTLCVDLIPLLGWRKAGRWYTGLSVAWLIENAGRRDGRPRGLWSRSKKKHFQSDTRLFVSQDDFFS